MKAQQVIFSLGGVIVLLLSAAILADETPTSRDSLLTVPQPLQEYYYRAIEPKRLSYAVDLWYDAVLKGDDDLVIERQVIILGLLQQDLDSSDYVLGAFERLLHRATHDALQLDTSESLKDDYPLLERLDREVYTHARQDFKVKERIFSAIQRTPALSNKYRLMSDYIEVLRRQVGLPRLKLAMKRDTNDLGQEKLAPVDVQVTEGVIGTPLEN